MTRRQRFLSVCEMAGSSVRVIDPADGWPGIADVKMQDGSSQRVALHVSVVSSHSRAPHEVRFQNPGSRRPVSNEGGANPLLLGYAEENGKAIFVAADGSSRLGRQARFSILFNRRVLKEAAAKGWSVYQSSSGESIYAFIPPLLPVLVQLIASDLSAHLPQTKADELQIAVSATGIVEENDDAAVERARRVATQLVRNYAFGRRVVSAYNDLCAMCGIDSGLVVGAHIKPVAAPDAPDRVWNGLALCHNHHAAFDLHKIWVHPSSRAIAFHPNLLAQAQTQQPIRALVDGTFGTLSQPTNPQSEARPEMFLERYNFYDPQYGWAKHLH